MSSTSNSLRHNVEKIKKCVIAVDDKSKLPCIRTDVSGCSIKLSGSRRQDGILQVDETAMSVLTQSGAINWCRTMQYLYPLKIATGALGFLQAASLAMWGFSEGAELLRMLIVLFITEHGTSLLKPRWIQQRLRRDETVHNRDWEAIVSYTTLGNETGSEFRMSSMASFPQPLHIFVLSNILKRTIIIVESPNQLVSTWTTFADSHRFTGIYLPLLQDAHDSVKSPLVFSLYDGVLLPLVGRDTIESNDQLLRGVDAFPLVSNNLESLEMQFLADSELRNAHSMLVNYVDVTEINLTTSEGLSLIIAAKLKYKNLDQVSDVIILNQQPTAQPVGNQQVGHGQPPASRQQNVAPPTGLPRLEQNPTAPPASIITFNGEVTPLHADEQNMTSLIPIHCRYPSCALYTSTRTAPYCYEHVEMGSVASPPSARVNQNQQESFLNSMMADFCAAPDCANHASENTYPFCYEHLGQRTRSDPLQQQEGRRSQPSGGANGEYQLSLMNEPCAQQGCVNNASRNTMPMCHEHALPARSVGIQTSESLQHLSSDPRVEVQYAGMMQDLETRTKRTATMCRSSDCRNYGNSRCRGYCHDCYTGLVATNHAPIH